MTSNQTWGSQLRKFRKKAKFKTQVQFIDALHRHHNIDIDQSILSKYENGKRIPEDRERHLELIETLITFGGITSPSEVNNWLASAKKGLLNDSELQLLFDASQTNLSAKQNSTVESNLPPIKTLPKSSHLPFRSNHHFTGRNAEIFQIAHQFLQSVKTNVILLTGIGGIGKTQLAIEYAHRYGNYYKGGVFWLNFSNVDTIPEQVASLYKLLNPRKHVPHTLSSNEQIDFVKQAWHQTSPRLLIFDNYEDSKILRDWLPTTGGAQVLITSRQDWWDPAFGFHQIKLAPLNRESSVSLLKKFSPEIPNQVASGLANTLGDLPLALQLGGTYLSFKGESIKADDYLKELNSLQRETMVEHPSLQGIHSQYSSTNHLLDISSTFSLSFDLLDDTILIDQVAKVIAYLCSYCVPNESIPEEFISSALSEYTQSLNLEEIHTEDLNRAIARLGNLGLAEIDKNELIRLHPLIASYLRANDPERVYRNYLEKGVLHRTKGLDDANVPLIPQTWITHLHEIAEVAFERADEIGIQINHFLAYALHVKRYYKESRKIYEATLEKQLENFGYQKTETALLFNDYGYLLQHFDELEKAKEHFEAALEIHINVGGEEQSYVGTTLNNLGTLYVDLQDFKKGIEYHKQALPIWKKTLGALHPKTAISLNNLGIAHQHIGEFEKAESYYLESLSIREKVFNELHPDIAQCYSNLGALYINTQQLNKAINVLEKALRIREQTIGTEHTDTLITLNNLGVAFYRAKKFDLARPHLEKLLSVRRKVLGETHPHTAAAYFHLGKLDQLEGNFVDAHKKLNDALKIFESRTDEPDSSIATANYQLGLLYKDMNNLHQAKIFLQDAYSMFTHVYGDKHPFTQKTLEDLNSID